jgi:hypothetical protein
VALKSRMTENLLIREEDAKLNGVVAAVVFDEVFCFDWPFGDGLGRVFREIALCVCISDTDINDAICSAVPKTTDTQVSSVGTSVLVQVEEYELLLLYCRSVLLPGLAIAWRVELS